MRRDSMDCNGVLCTVIGDESSSVSLPAPTTVYKRLIVLHGQLLSGHIVACACDCLLSVRSEKTVGRRLHRVSNEYSSCMGKVGLMIRETRCEAAQRYLARNCKEASMNIIEKMST